MALCVVWEVKHASDSVHVPPASLGVRHNPEVEGPKGDYQTCARFGEDMGGYEPPPKNMYRGIWG